MLTTSPPAPIMEPPFLAAMAVPMAREPKTPTRQTAIVRDAMETVCLLSCRSWHARARWNGAAVLVSAFMKELHGSNPRPRGRSVRSPLGQRRPTYASAVPGTGAPTTRMGCPCMPTKREQLPGAPLIRGVVVHLVTTH